MDETTRENLLQYHKDYYHNYYKDIIKTKKCFCDVCNMEVSAWNMYKHKNSNKHKFNSLPEYEKMLILEKKNKDKIKIPIDKALEIKERLEKKLNAINNIINVSV